MLCSTRSLAALAFTAGATMAIFSPGALAGQLVSFDAAVSDATLRTVGVGPAAPADTAKDADASAHCTIGREALEAPYVFYCIVEASSDSNPAIGSFTPPIRVRLRFHDGVLEIVQDRSALYGDMEGAPEAIVNRFPARDAGASLEVDLARSATVGDGYMPVTPSTAALVRGFSASSEVITWAQVLLTRPQAPTFEAPLSDTIKTIAFRYWLVKARDQGYTPRDYPDADQGRIGLFSVDEDVKGAPGKVEARTHARLWDASKAITFYLHPTIPQDLRPHVRQAILSWNEAFHKALGRDVVSVVDGKDAGVLPGTPGGIVVYWADYPLAGDLKNVMALGWALPDPHTGEARAGYILVNGACLRQQVAVFSQEAADLPGMGIEGLSSPPSSVTTTVTPPGGAALHFSLPSGYPASTQAMLDAREFVDPSTLSPADALAKMVREVIAHEAGHTLGLRHNFKGTADLAHCRSGEVTTTLMDYPVYLTSIDHPGPYDEAAIAYAYSGAAVADGGAAGPMLYATDEDVGHDPDANKFDEGEPLSFYASQLSYYRKLRNSPRFATDGVYLDAVAEPLEHLRRFVGASAPERSEKAFEAIMSVLTPAAAAGSPEGHAAPGGAVPGAPPPTAGSPAVHTPAGAPATAEGDAGPLDAAAAGSGAAADDGASIDVRASRIAITLLTSTTLDWDKDHPLPRLDDDHAAQVAQAMGRIAADTTVPKSLRLQALDGLVTLHRMSAYQELEQLNKAWAGVATTQAADTAGQRERELAIKASKALAGYY